MAPPAVVLELYRVVACPPMSVLLNHSSKLPPLEPAAATATARMQEHHGRAAFGPDTEDPLPEVQDPGPVGRDETARLLLVPRSTEVVHVCPFDAEKRFSTFHDWKNHVVNTHRSCLVKGEDNPLLQQGYAASLRLDKWFHKIVVEEWVARLGCMGVEQREVWRYFREQTIVARTFKEQLAYSEAQRATGHEGHVEGGNS